LPVSVELSENNKHVVINAEWRLKELCKSIPGAKWDSTAMVWSVPASWATCLALRSTFKNDLVIGPRLTEWAGNELANRITPANELRDLETLEDPLNEDLFPHQRAGVKFLATARRALLADEPGLGKTAQAIRALKQLQDNGETIFPALIVCPNTLKKNWKREFDKWWPGLDIQIIKGSATQRRKQFDEPAQVFIINWESRALWAATGDADIRYALTGTPIANNVLDLWSILHWISPEEWPSKTRWIDRMVNTMINAFGGMMVLGVKPHMEPEFYAALNPRMRRMLKAKVLPWLPEMMFERRDVEMSTKQKKAYEQMRDMMIAELEGGEALTAPSVLTQTIRLLQFASSYAEIAANEETGEIKAVLADPSCKVDALMDDIKSGDFGNDSVAVCAVSRQLIYLLSAALTKEKIEHGLITGAQSEDERQQAVDDFQAGKIKWILFTAQAGGVGITLTAARRLIMLQRPWSLVDHRQALDRVHRIGSEIHDSIIVTDYVTEGTIEERVIQVLETKADNFEQIVRDKDKLLTLLKDDKAGNL
jgi:SNF2 family DNA or RNA helicase